jgi:hypothetical protein
MISGHRARLSAFVTGANRNDYYLNDKENIAHIKRKSAFSSAVSAGSEKIDPVTFDGEIGRAADFIVNLGKKPFFKIGYGAAFAADEVVVGGGFRFEAVEGAACIDFAHNSLLDKDRKVPVNGAEAEAGKFRFHPVIEPYCGRMIFSRAEYGKETFPLAAVSVGFFRSYLFHNRLSGLPFFVNVPFLKRFEKSVRAGRPRRNISRPGNENESPGLSIGKG